MLVYAPIGVLMLKPIMKAIKSRDIVEDFISRPALAARWGCHVETLKRREKAGLLHPHGFSTRLVRYRMSEVLALEYEAGELKKRGGNAGSFVSTRSSAADSKGPKESAAERSGDSKPRAQKQKRPSPAGVTVDLELL